MASFLKSKLYTVTAEERNEQNQETMERSIKIHSSIKNQQHNDAINTYMSILTLNTTL